MLPIFITLFPTLLALTYAASNSDIKDLIPRAKQPYPQLIQPDTEPELLDVVLVASVDGKFRALNRTSGQTLWSMTSYISSETTSPASSLAPLVRTVHLEHDPDLVDDQEIYIIEPQSGDIYVMPTPSSPLQRFPFSMPELVDMSPFSFSDSDDPRVFVGRKETSLLLIELETGKIKATLNSACPWDPFEDLQQADADVDLDELEGAKLASLPATEVFIGRTDYHISILPPRSAKRAPVQNLSFSTYGPNNQDNLLQASYRRTRDDCYIQGLPNGDVISFKAGSSEKSQSKAMWGRQFDSPIIAVFDVLRKPSMRPSAPPHTFVLLQPRPKLQDLGVPSVDNANVIPNSRSAYVGIVEETGSLFAMSPSNYPLVAFGDASRHTRPDQIEGRVDELPSNVDDVTQYRKEKERADRAYARGVCNPANQFDRRCLVGVRELDGAEIEAPSRTKIDHPSIIADQPNGSVPEVDDEPWPNVGKANWGIKVVLQVLVTLIGGASVWYVFGPQKRPEGLSNSLALQSEVLAINSSNIIEPVTSTAPTLPATSKPAPLSLKDNSATEDVEDSDHEGEDAIGVTPVTGGGKRKYRRGRRGGTRKKATLMDGKEEKEEKEEMVENVDNMPEPTLVTPTPKPTATTSLVVSDIVLGFGSHGTVVYRGSFQGRAVAVKRLLQDFVTWRPEKSAFFKRATTIQTALSRFPRRYHRMPGPEPLRDLAIAFDPKRALREITSGLRHLHALKLVHRDIKPQNILVSFPKSTGNSKGTYRMLISDFGLCKKLDVDQTSFLPTAYGAMAAGTVGWRAPEILRGEVKLDEVGDNSISSSRGSNGTVNGSASAKPTRLTKSVDIFALGCLFYYTVTNGSHPFGDRYEREVNILKNSKNLEGLERFGEEGSEAADLIQRMLDPEACERPDTTTCLLHPFFWNSGRRLNFLQDASDMFENMCREPRDPLLVLLEKDAANIVGHDWQARLDKIFLENLGKFRKYDGRSVQDLLRALRNKKNHYQDLPDNVKRHMGTMPEGYLAYFTRRFPRLFLHVHSVINTTPLRLEPRFRSYFEVPD